MKPIERLRRAILDYEQETGTYIDEIHLEDRTLSDSKHGKQYFDDFELFVVTKSFE